MINFNTPIMKTPPTWIKNHVEKCIKAPGYNSKILLVSAVGLDIFGNVVDSVQIRHNKQLPKQEKKYLVAYKLVNAFISGILELIAGFVIAHPRVQAFFCEKLLKGINRNSTEFKTYSTGLNLLSTLFISTVLIKRLVAPVIITPLAAKFKNTEI